MVNFRLLFTSHSAVSCLHDNMNALLLPVITESLPEIGTIIEAMTFKYDIEM